jgi:hypothetical protein
MQFGYQNAKFDADFESVEKVANGLMWKKLLAKKWQKNWVFYISLPITSFGRIFLHFFSRIRTQHHSVRFMIPV